MLLFVAIVARRRPKTIMCTVHGDANLAMIKPQTIIMELNATVINVWGKNKWVWKLTVRYVLMQEEKQT